jgi:hypothetical protein
VAAELDVHCIAGNYAAYRQGPATPASAVCDYTVGVPCPFLSPYPLRPFPLNPPYPFVFASVQANTPFRVSPLAIPFAGLFDKPFSLPFLRLFFSNQSKKHFWN